MGGMIQNVIQNEQESKYLTFALEKEAYGLGIIKIKKILGIMSISHVRQMPPYVKGIINFRGVIIPILDLRIRFGMKEFDNSKRTCIFVVEPSDTSKTASQFGMLIDAVPKVTNGIKNNTDDLSTLWDVGKNMYISGLEKVGRNIKILLDIVHFVNGKKKKPSLHTVTSY